jgi:hypothetical protein
VHPITRHCVLSVLGASLWAPGRIAALGWSSFLAFHRRWECDVLREPKSPLSAYALKGRQEHRTHNLRTMNGYGLGCDICGGDFNTRTFMTLSLGFYKARILVDFCEVCAKRLSAIVDARLEDRRVRR